MSCQLTLDPGTSQDAVARFTDAGGQYAIDLMVYAKGAENVAERDLDYREAQALKLLLKRVIETSASDLPEFWRKENVWRENHILRG